MAALSEREMRVLAFERGWWRSPGAKEQEIRDALGMTATSYYQLLNDLIDRPEALVFDPALVTRLRRQRARRHRMRSAGPDRRRRHPLVNGPRSAASGTVSLPVPVTPEGRAGLAALLGDPGQALVALDFDGTLSPIVADPAAARAHPGAVPALRRVAAAVGTLAVITGRPAASAVDLGGFAAVPDLIVLGHYGLERWAGRDALLTAVRRRGRRRPAPSCPACWPGPPRRTGRGSRTRATRSRCTPGRRLIRRRPWTGSATRWPAWPPGTGWPSSPGGW